MLLLKIIRNKSLIVVLNQCFQKRHAIRGRSTFIPQQKIGRLAAFFSIGVTVLAGFFYYEVWFGTDFAESPPIQGKNRVYQAAQDVVKKLQLAKITSAKGENLQGTSLRGLSSINPNFQSKYHKTINKITFIKENGTFCHVNLQGPWDQFLLPSFMKATSLNSQVEETEAFSLCTNCTSASSNPNDPLNDIKKYLQIRGTKGSDVNKKNRKKSPYQSFDESTCELEDRSEIEKMSRIAIKNPIKVAGWPILIIGGVGAIVGCTAGFLNENERNSEEAVERIILTGAHTTVLGAAVGALQQLQEVKGATNAMMKAGAKAGAKIFGVAGVRAIST